MLIRDVLKLKGAKIFSIAPGARVSEAVSHMVREDIGSLVVMESGRMVGVVTFREVLRAIDAQDGNLGLLECEEIMVREPACGHPDDSVDYLRELMTNQHVRYLPVVDNGELLGVISFHDVARTVIKQTSLENRLLKRYIKNWPDEEPAGNEAGK